MATVTTVLVLITQLLTVLAVLAAAAPFRPHPIRGRCPPLRTMPDLDARRDGKFRPTTEFLREWCHPSRRIVFPTLPGVNQRHSINRNPYFGFGVERGSVPIVFPSHAPLQANRRPYSREDASSSSHSSEEEVFEFINSKMHPSLIRPRGQRLALPRNPYGHSSVKKVESPQQNFILDRNAEAANLL